MTETREVQAVSGLRPDYRGGGIVNLMGSIIAARGGVAAAPPLTLLPPDELAGATNLVLLVIDGLGADWLARRSPEGILSGHGLGALTSVFPSTTAAAITTFLTGDAPLAHGLTGWFTWMGELACVMTVLPGVPRYGGVPYRQAGLDPVRLFGHRSVFDRLADPCVVLSPSRISGSDFNLAHCGSAQVLAYQGLKDLFGRSARTLKRDRGRKFLYLYWPELDSIGHTRGMGSPESAQHLTEIESALEEFMGRIAGSDTLVLVTADHGQVDSTPADLIDLAQHPQLADCLAMPLCGEPRAAFAYLRNGREGDFLDYCRGPLAGLVEVRRSRALRDQGYFGEGETHPRFDERIGDYCLLPTGNRVLRQLLPWERPHRLIGQHGGLTRSELLVPLCLLRA